MFKSQLDDDKNATNKQFPNNTILQAPFVNCTLVDQTLGASDLGLNKVMPRWILTGNISYEGRSIDSVVYLGDSALENRQHMAPGFPNMTIDST